MCVDNLRAWSLPEQQPALGKRGRGWSAGYRAQRVSQMVLAMTAMKLVAADTLLPVLTLGIGWSLAVHPTAILRMLYMQLGTQLNAVTILGNR